MSSGLLSTLKLAANFMSRYSRYVLAQPVKDSTGCCFVKRGGAKLTCFSKQRGLMRSPNYLRRRLPGVVERPARSQKRGRRRQLLFGEGGINMHPENRFELLAHLGKTGDFGFFVLACVASAIAAIISLSCLACATFTIFCRPATLPGFPDDR